jgi:transcriptional regulator GlxA family with amidase domain
MVTQSRRQKVRTVAVCAGTLLLMALGLYLGLAHQESTGSLESAAPIGAAGIV